MRVVHMNGLSRSVCPWLFIAHSSSTPPGIGRFRTGLQWCEFYRWRWHHNVSITGLILDPLVWGDTCVPVQWFTPWTGSMCARCCDWLCWFHCGHTSGGLTVWVLTLLSLAALPLVTFCFHSTPSIWERSVDLVVFLMHGFYNKHALLEWYGIGMGVLF